jgi:hypothetical protein
MSDSPYQVKDEEPPINLLNKKEDNEENKD